MIGRVALLLVVATPAAAAEPAEVAFVNLTADAAGQTAIASLRAGLRGRRDPAWRAAPVRPALERPRLPAAGAKPPPLDLDAARAAYRRFDTKAALAALDAAESARLHHSPSPELYRQLADIAVLRGQVLAGAGRKDSAIAAFAAAQALEPERELDPARHPPAIRALYARGAPSGQASLAIEADAGVRLWVDGERVGDAPLKPLEVTEGPHLVTAVLAGHRVESVWAEGEVAVELTPLPRRERAAELRDTLSPRALDLGVLGQIAEVAGVDALVVVARRDGALAAALYHRRGNSLSPWSDPNPSLFGPPPAGPPIAGTGGDEDRPWFRTWWGIGLLGGAAVVTAVTVVVVATDADVSFSLP